MRPDDAAPADDAAPPTADPEYAERLARLGSARWKQVLDVQRPYRAHLRRLRLGRTLDVGCGTGRNLRALDPGSVGVDHNPHSIGLARAAGLPAVTVEEFFADPELTRPDGFDSMLVAHVVEHMTPDDALAVVGSYLPFVRDGGRVVLITPQERGYASDPTHVTFTDLPALRRFARDLGVVVERGYSFPFPRVAGKVFTYNEFVLVGHVARG
jgi:SAM-dependent methyltransferase